MTFIRLGDTIEFYKQRQPAKFKLIGVDLLAEPGLMQTILRFEREQAGVQSFVGIEAGYFIRTLEDFAWHKVE